MVIIDKFLTNSPDETTLAARKFAACLIPGDGVAFRGGMGAGKTHFTKGIAAALGIRDEISSPTFSLVNEYLSDTGILLFHFDLFRLKTIDDLAAIGFYDYLNRNGICVMEWSENFGGEVEREFSRCYVVAITQTGENTREINITLQQSGIYENTCN
ncbi:tRNA (adenosine(37)-N6)-threonylcarbamoyltransferase complex ATPase subunit type 1 TsaE [Clostridia bacterium]|nr:tRNA (adenosine(37)-N6)-threonylcarbamoyltransferase complex ATPase subunit type 1 TsaE [Clostridia bacterium]